MIERPFPLFELGKEILDFNVLGTYVDTDTNAETSWTKASSTHEYVRDMRMQKNLDETRTARWKGVFSLLDVEQLVSDYGQTTALSKSESAKNYVKQTKKKASERFVVKLDYQIATVVLGRNNLYLDPHFLSDLLSLPVFDEVIRNPLVILGDPKYSAPAFQIYCLFP